MSQHCGVERTGSVCQFGPGDVRQDDVGNRRDGHGGDDLQCGGFPQQRFDRLQVLERLGDVSWVLAVRVRGSRRQAFDEYVCGALSSTMWLNRG